MPSIQYPIDTTGFAPTNLIVDEIHMLTEINSTTYRILIPEFAPLYLDNFELKHVDMDGNIATLVEDVDFHFCLPYIGGSRSIGKMIYGGITITNLLINGVLKLTYQTLGGEWTADKNYVMTRLAETVYNPRITVWDVVTNVQSLFPPINHDQSFDYVYGHQDLIASINDLAVTIANGPNPNSGLIGHFRDFNNPHQVTKEQVGLGLVVNYPMATNSDIANKNPVDKYITLNQLLTVIATIPASTSNVNPLSSPEFYYLSGK